MKFDDERIRIRNKESGKVVLECMEDGGLSNEIKRASEALIREVPSTTWHGCLWHLHDQATLKLINDHLIAACNKKLSLCHSCMINKTHALMHASRKNLFETS